MTNPAAAIIHRNGRHIADVHMDADTLAALARTVDRRATELIDSLHTDTDPEPEARHNVSRTLRIAERLSMLADEDGATPAGVTIGLAAALIVGGYAAHIILRTLAEVAHTLGTALHG